MTSFRARRGSLERELVRMPAAFGQANLPVRAQLLERARGQLDALGAGAPPFGTGDGIDDDDGARHNRETSRNPSDRA